MVSPGLLPRLICWAVGLPRHGADQPVSIAFFTNVDGVDRWLRDFDGRRYKSELRAGTGSRQGKLIEHLGMFTTVFALEARAGHLLFEVVQMKLLGVPLPRPLLLRCQAFETGQDGLFMFDIAIGMPLIGRLIHYRGTLSQCKGGRTANGRIKAKTVAETGGVITREVWERIGYGDRPLPRRRLRNGAHFDVSCCLVADQSACVAFSWIRYGDRRRFSLVAPAGEARNSSTSSNARNARPGITF